MLDRGGCRTDYLGELHFLLTFRGSGFTVHSSGLTVAGYKLPDFVIIVPIEFPASPSFLALRLACRPLLTALCLGRTGHRPAYSDVAG